MNVFIDYQFITQPWGGINSFLRSLVEYIKKYKHDVELSDRLNNKTDIVLISAAYCAPGKEINIDAIKKIINNRYSLKSKLLKKTDLKIVHRLDGLRAIYNNEFIQNDQLQIDLSQLADFIIFQSKFSQESFCKYSKIDKYVIIHNGTDHAIFNMDGKKFYKNGKLKILSASWSSSLYKGFNAIADFSENTDVECVHVGRWNENVDKKNVKLINPLIREDMALAYKDADIFLHAAQNDPCPNVVIEALSSGLPVIYHNSGGTTELAEGYGFPLPIDMNYESINALIGNIKVQYDSIISNIRENLNQFSIATSAEKYLEYLYMVHKNEI